MARKAAAFLKATEDEDRIPVLTEMWADLDSKSEGAPFAKNILSSQVYPLEIWKPSDGRRYGKSSLDGVYDLDDTHICTCICKLASMIY